jgi:hypothetical protein
MEALTIMLIRFHDAEPNNIRRCRIRWDKIMNRKLKGHRSGRCVLLLFLRSFWLFNDDLLIAEDINRNYYVRGTGKY